jgi:hypothetical protein
MRKERKEERNAQVDRENAKDDSDEQKRVYEAVLRDFLHIASVQEREAAARRVTAEYMAEFTNYDDAGGSEFRGARAVLAALNQTLAEYAMRATPPEDVARVKAAQKQAEERVIEMSRRQGGATRRSSLPRLLAMRSSSATRRTYSRRRRA